VGEVPVRSLGQSFLWLGSENKVVIRCSVGVLRQMEFSLYNYVVPRTDRCLFNRVEVVKCFCLSHSAGVATELSSGWIPSRTNLCCPIQSKSSNTPRWRPFRLDLVPSTFQAVETHSAGLARWAETHQSAIPGAK
jgi:hypothetical protein